MSDFRHEVQPSNEMPKPFIEITEEQLLAWSQDEEGIKRLLRYVHGARQAGRPELAAGALTILLISQEKIVRGYVGRTIPRQEVEEVTGSALVELVESIHDNPPEAVNLTQLRGWMSVVVYRHCAGIYRTRQEEFRRSLASLDEEYADGGSLYEARAGNPDFGYDLSDYMDVVARNLEDLSDEHRLVIGYSVFADMPSKEVAEVLAERHDLDFTPNNIDQIAGRFRRKCRSDLEEQ